MKNRIVKTFEQHSGIKFYKWVVGDDIYCARVVNTTANYYKNGKIYVEYQQFIPRDSDIEISQSEFNILIGINI
jgi:hypothetical protein